MFKNSFKYSAKGGNHEREIVLFDMHVHSRFSADSVIPVNDIVKSWEWSGVLPLVCDHNTVAGSVNVYKEICATDPDMPQILAEEILTSDGEIIGAFLQEEIMPFMSAEETLDAIRDQGGISIVPHPFCSFRSSVIRPDVLDRIIPRVDIIEGFNGRAVDERDNDCARRYVVLHDKPVSAGSDAHTPEELGKTYLAMRPFDTPADLILGIRKAAIHVRRAFVQSHGQNRISPGAPPREITI
jgi:predicted metal-dependent phosphoesterase TrpH